MKIGNLEILIGSDPELFVKKDGDFISGHELIPGTKEAPHKVQGGAVQVDGTALEFNTEPAKTFDEFNASTNMVLDALKNMIPPELELVANPTAHFAKEYMNKLPDEVKRLGCDPDYNAYTGTQNRAPNADVDFRTGAGHVHIGWTHVDDPFEIGHMSECCALVQALDVFLGAPSVLLDTDRERRMLYGKAGAFRPKTYGVEYRVLSNFWVLDEKLREWVYNNTLLAVKRLMDKDRPLTQHYGYAVSSIDTSHAAYAEKVLRMYNVPMPPGFKPEQRPLHHYGLGG